MADLQVRESIEFLKLAVKQWLATVLWLLGLAGLIFWKSLPAYLADMYGLRWATALLFGAPLFWAFYRVWRDEHRRRLELEKKLATDGEGRSLPQVRVGFVGEQDVLNVRLTEPKLRTPEEKAALLNELRNKHLFLSEPAEKPKSFPAAEGLPKVRLNIMMPRNATLQQLSGEEELSIEKYNARLESYFQAYAEWLAASDVHALAMARSVELRLDVWNEGTAPAHDLDVTITAGPGVSLYEEDDKALWEPSEPVLPSRVIHTLRPQPGPFSLPVLNIPELPDPDPSVEIARDCVTAWTRKLKQQQGFKIKQFVLLWEGEPSRVTLRYTANADELPNEFSGEISVVPELVHG